MPWPTPAACAKVLAVTLVAVTLAGCAGGWRPHVRRYEAHEEATGSRVEVVPAARPSREAAAHDLVRPPAPSASRAAREPSPDRQPRRARPAGAPTASAGEVRYEPLSPAGGGAPSAVAPEVPAAPTRSSPGRLFVARGGAASSPTPASPTPAVEPDEESAPEEAEEDAHGHPEGAGDDEELAPDEVEEPLAPRDAPPPRGDGPRLADRRDPFYRTRVNADGIAAPYPPDRMFRGFGRCIRGTRHHHEGIDLGGIGPLWGLGTPIRSMARAEIVFIGRGDQNPELFGTPDLRRGTVKRGRSVLPRRAFVEGYGEVAFFTRRKGRWRSGNIIVTRGVEGPLKGHIIRYMHMGAIHPDMHPGRIVEAGEELALMGGTGVQESAPHLHLDIEAPGGHRVDVAPLVGLPPTASCEGVPTGLGDVDLAAATVPTANRYKHVPTHGEASARVATPPRPTSLAGRATGLRPTPGGGARASGRDNDEEDDEEAEAGDDVGRVLFRRAEYGCAQKTFEEDFSSGRYDAHAYVVKLQRGEVLDVRLKGARGGWSGRLGAVGRGVSAKSSRGGITTVRASADAEVILKIEDARGGRPPKTASYSLALKGKCRGKATRPQRPAREPKARPAKAPRPKQGAPTRKPGRFGRSR